jgi:SAM-dependent methyltransferase
VGHPPEFGGFSDVDGTGAAAAYAAYLAEVADVDAVREWKERSFALLEPRPGAVLLDAGCGLGDDVRALAARVAPGGRALGVDASASMVAEARRRGLSDGVQFMVGDVERLDLEDASVDGCRAERTFQHLAHPSAAARELARVVRPGGRVVVSEPDWGTLVVDPGDPQLVREVARAGAARVRSGEVGRALRRLLVEAGLVEVGVVTRTLVVTHPGQAERLFGLEGAAQGAVAAGRLARADAEGWRTALEDAGRDDRFLAAMTAFMAWGRRA